MRAVDAVRSGFKRYVAFSGRSSRSEFWWFWLFSWLAWLAAGIADLVLWKATGSQAFFPITVTDFATPHEQIRVYATATFVGAAHQLSEGAPLASSPDPVLTEDQLHVTSRRHVTSGIPGTK
jgi:hypothetical protein